MSMKVRLAAVAALAAGLFAALPASAQSRADAAATIDALRARAAGIAVPTPPAAPRAAAASSLAKLRAQAAAAAQAKINALKQIGR